MMLRFFLFAAFYCLTYNFSFAVKTIAELQIDGMEGKNRFSDPPKCHEFLDDQRGLTRFLSLDGGGLRGVLSSTILENLEKQTSIENRAIAEIFQAGIAGTSTGSLIALALASPWHRDIDGHPDSKEDRPWAKGPYSASEIITLYQEIGEEIFVPKYNACSFYGTFYCLYSFIPCCFCTPCFFCCKSCKKSCGGLVGPRYSNNRIQEKLEYFFGDMVLGETVVPVTVPTLAIQSNNLNAVENQAETQIVYFNSYKHPKLKLSDAALASSAAPTFFPPAKI